MQALVNRLNALCDAQPFHTGWYLKHLRTGEEHDRHGHLVVPSASTRKIAIMMAAMKAVHEGRLSLDQPVTITDQYQWSNSGTFQHFQPGFTLPLQDVMTMMIIVSDNAATGHVADLVGLDHVQALSESIGMKGTTHRHGVPPNLGREHAGDATNTTTPADVGLLLDLILQGTTDAAAAARLGSTRELCQLAMQILLWQKLNQRLPLFLPKTARVAHKTGTGARNYNDAGIICDEESPLFILTVYTDNVPQDFPDMSGAARASLLIGNLARACYDALKA
ncbi:MAG: beta-lactamase [Firmicutes bacterium]|nr:beta-lactamase [Bacillota bacterium]